MVYEPRTFLVFIAMKKLIYFLIIALALSACQQNQAGDSSDKQPDTATGKKSNADQGVSRRDSLSLLINENPDDASLYAARAKYNLGINRMQEALNDINQAMALDSNLATAYEAQGEYYFAVNQSRQARNAWNRCLKLDPNNSECLMKMAELMITVQDYERALELVNRQLDIDNKDPQAYFIKGIILRDRYKDTATALQYFQNAMDLKQDYLAAIDMMGTTLLQKRDTMARYYFERVLEINPNRDDIYHKLGIHYMNNDQPNRALESYSKAIQLNPNNADAYYNMGYMNTTWRQFKEARGYFTKAIEVGDQDYKSYFGRGLTYEMTGDILNAREDYRRALKELPVFKPASEALARVNAMIKESEAGQ